MAIEDVSFYNLIGEEVSRSSIVSQMINFYALKREVGETQVTDFNEGSEIRNMLESVAVEGYMIMEEQNELTSIGFIDSAEGEWLDKHGAKPSIQLPRDVGSEATGFVTFTIPEAVSIDTIIPEGIIVTNEDGLEFATDGEGLISVGEQSCIVPVTCLTVGSDGNVPANSITIIDDDYVNIPGLTVNNYDAFAEGTDYEEDYEYRERLLAYVRQDDFGSMGYYNRLGVSVDGVHDVLLVDTTGYTKKVLVNGDVKPCPVEVVAETLAVFSDLNNIVVGHTFTAEACQCDAVDLTVNLEMEYERPDTDFLKVLELYFDGGSYDIFEFDGLYIDDIVTKERLVDILMSIDGVIDVEVLYDDDVFTEITPETNHVLKLDDVTINQTIQS